MADKAKQAIDDRGGTERLKQEAERLRDIATGPGTAKDKSKAAGDALKRAGTETPSERTAPQHPEPPVGGGSAPRV